MLTQVEFSVNNHRVRPGFGFLVGRHEGTLEFVCLGVGFDEGDVAALVAVDEVSIDVSDCGGTVPGSFFRAPFDLAGFHFNADGISTVVLVGAVNVSVDKDHATVVVLKGLGFQEVNFFGGFSIELEEGRSGAVAGGAEDKVTIDDGSGDVGGVVGNGVVVPEKLAVIGADADDSAAGHLDVLLHAAAVGDHDGAIARAVFASFAKVADFGFPFRGSGFFVERDHEGIVASGSADDTISINEGRFGEAPAGHHFSLPFLFEILGPNDLSFGAEAGDDPVGGGDVKVVAIDGGHGAGAAVAVLGNVIGDRSLPEKFAVFGGERGDALAAVKVAGGVNDTIGDGHRGEAFACTFDVPKKLGRALVPILNNALFG